MTAADVISAAAHAGRISTVTILASDEKDARERLQVLTLLPETVGHSEVGWVNDSFGAFVYFKDGTTILVVHRRAAKEAA